MADDGIKDLIIDESVEEEKNSKSIMLLVGMIVLLFIIGVMLANSIFGTSSDANGTKEDNQSSFLSGFLGGDSKKEVNKTKTSNEVKKDTISIDNSKKSEPSNDLSSDLSDDLSSDLGSLGDDSNIANDIPKEEQPKVKEQQVENSAAKSVAQENIVKKEPKKSKKESVEEHNRKILSQFKHQKSEHKKEHSVTHKTTTHTSSKIGGVGNVYIQVGAFTKGPNQEFINKIIKAGFRYRIKNVGNVRRVFVGPFRSRDEASRYLGRVKAQISSEAFIK